MDALELIREQTRDAWTWLELVVGDVGDDHANRWPPGTANSIATTYLHIVINADVEGLGMLFGHAPLVERRWNGRVGQSIDYDPDLFDDWPPRGAELDWKLLRGYGRAVHEEFVKAVDTVTTEHLTAPIDMTRSGLGMWTGLDILSLHGWGHVKIHGGEIAVLKGIQGAHGYGEGMFGHGITTGSATEKR